jgi:RNA polymerase sigma-70 factor (ECF subfamily)
MDVITVVNAQSEGVSRLETEEETFDFEATFHAEYARIARVIARLVQDPARAEELAVETFWKLLQKPGAQGPQVGGWLYRTAVRMGLDELRRRKRQVRYEGEVRLSGSAPTPEQIFTDGERLERVQTVLSRLSERDAGLLLGLGDGWSYQEMASGLDLNPASVGTFLRRAKDAFRKEYVKRYGRESE